jgi:hypothetical protein
VVTTVQEFDYRIEVDILLGISPASYESFRGVGQSWCVGKFCWLLGSGNSDGIAGNGKSIYLIYNTAKA